ncbi:hypothetical protein FGG08_006537 [Glutinoglossum americanum]|uniref:Uncharacterized protein n=1 Tax=Glutinoglossum americanum TaxID=1670608 RepID=A0A9P8I133_9PEZI|nr:hypothetical protein FGG08_006537 [Glutinoglossum americanum]
MQAAPPQVVQRDTHRSDSSQENSNCLAVYDATKHTLRLWKDEELDGANFIELNIPRWRNRMRIPLNEVDNKAGVKTGVVKLDRLGREFNLRRRFMLEHKKLYVLYGEKNELDMWEMAAGTQCESPVAANTSLFAKLPASSGNN